MVIDITTYVSIFLIAFLAATLLPAQSELALAGLLAAGSQPAAALILAAWAGNTLGSASNWLLGYYVQRFSTRRWFPLKAHQLQKSEGWHRRYGRWSLLLSWMPVIGDPLTLAAGVLREPFWSFISIVAFAKLARYLVVAGITFQWLGMIP